jgi:hypothetical protein
MMDIVGENSEGVWWRNQALRGSGPAPGEKREQDAEEYEAHGDEGVEEWGRL